MTAFRILLFVLALAGCDPLSFHPNESRTYERRVKVASRLEHEKASCESIGTLTFDDPNAGKNPDVVIDAIASKVASVGGTHYIVRTRTERTRRGKERPASSVINVLICSSSDND